MAEGINPQEPPFAERGGPLFKGVILWLRFATRQMSKILSIKQIRIETLGSAPMAIRANEVNIPGLLVSGFHEDIGFESPEYPPAVVMRFTLTCVKEVARGDSWAIANNNFIPEIRIFAKQFITSVFPVNGCW